TAAMSHNNQTGMGAAYRVRSLPSRQQLHCEHYVEPKCFAVGLE
ncbi:MAG: hypothetical protein QOF25_615, partial [Mycobacterium sp.]|nr:hypothetical protein [Mycobacterium sp.]